MGKQRVSRRQFLNYTLTGVGGFMAAGMLMPMVRFAIDPVLKVSASGDFIATTMKESDLSTEPQRVSFLVQQKDAWYDSQETRVAWVFKDEAGEIVALSPICKHLGCVVDWNTDSKNPNRFFCNCHNGLYEKDGMNVKGTPPMGPLDMYLVQVEDGIIKLGAIEPNRNKGA